MCSALFRNIQTSEHKISLENRADFRLVHKRIELLAWFAPGGLKGEKNCLVFGSSPRPDVRQHALGAGRRLRDSDRSDATERQHQHRDLPTVFNAGFHAEILRHISEVLNVQRNYFPLLPAK